MRAEAARVETARAEKGQTEMTKAEMRVTERMRDLEKAKRFGEILKELYPEALCSLEADGDPWRLLVMARLSAQCTDERVNEVCKELFRLFPTCFHMAKASQEDVEKVIRPCGLYRGKAKSLCEISKILAESYKGRVPDTMEELLSLPGVGRKIANLVLGDIYGKGGIVADTHCIRICGRLGFYPTEEKNPLRVERIMEKSVPKGEQSDFCHRIVRFGRDVCNARNPKCGSCPAKELCDQYNIYNKGRKAAN